MRQSKVDSAKSRPLTRSIAVEAEHRHRRCLPHQLQLVFGERRTERRHRILDPRLVQRDHVHVAFDGDQRVGAIGALHGAAGPRKVVEHVALMEELRLVGIEILRHGIRCHGAAAESDDLIA